MKIIACIKQIPDVTEIRFDPERRTLVRQGVPLVVNPLDRPALSLAVSLKARFGADTTALTMGPPQAREALYEALASGLDHGVHLSDPAFAGSDTLATARTLAACISRRGADLILCGKYTLDGETAQVGPELAELLDLPHVAGVEHVDFSDDGLLATCTRETDEGREVIEVRLPCLLTVAESLLPPVAVRKQQLEAARAQPIQTVTAADLGLPVQATGAAGSPTWVAGIRALPQVARPPLTLLTGAPEEIAAELMRLMKELLAEPDAEQPPAEPERRQGPGGSGRDVWVGVERDHRGRITAGTIELLGAAAELAAQLGGAAVAVLIGGPGAPESLDAECGAAGADAVLAIEHPALADYSSEGHAAALQRAILDREAPQAPRSAVHAAAQAPRSVAWRPEIVLLPSTERGRDLAPRLAARLRLGLTGDAVGLSLDDGGRLVALKPAFAGEVVAPILSRTTPQMATVRPGVLQRRASRSGRAARREVLSLEEAPLIRTRLLRSEVTVDEGAAGLAGARFVVGVGMGLGDPSHLSVMRELAQGLGGAVCATRRVADKGWMPRQVQVGLTGHAIAPRVYLAIGVRGVQNHAIGVRRAGTILAINKDPKAQIFQLARYGVVADWAEIVPLLIKNL